MHGTACSTVGAPIPEQLQPILPRDLRAGESRSRPPRATRTEAESHREGERTDYGIKECAGPAGGGGGRVEGALEGAVASGVAGPVGGVAAGLLIGVAVAGVIVTGAVMAAFRRVLRAGWWRPSA